MNSVTQPTVLPATAGGVPWAALGLPIALVALVVAGVASTGDFLTADNIDSLLQNTAIVGIAAVAMTPMTISGNFFSLATTQTTVAGALLFLWIVGNGTNALLAVVVVVAALIVIGLVQGFVIDAGLSPVLTTLAVGAIVYGATASITDGRLVTVGQHPVSWGDSQPLGVSLSIYVFVIFTAILTVVIRGSVMGRHVVLAGANRATAAVNGISSRRVTLWVFAIFSVGLAVAGVLSAAQVGSLSSSSFTSLTVDAAAAVLVGGTAVQGGFGSPLRSAAGALVITLTTNILLLNGMSDGARQTVVGAVVLGVVIGLQVLRTRAAS